MGKVQSARLPLKGHSCQVVKGTTSPQSPLIPNVPLWRSGADDGAHSAGLQKLPAPEGGPLAEPHTPTGQAVRPGGRPADNRLVLVSGQAQSIEDIERRRRIQRQKLYQTRCNITYQPVSITFSEPFHS